MKIYFSALIFLGLTLSFYAQDIISKEYNIESKYFNKERTIHVHLPENIKEEEKLPVIFVFDSQKKPFYNQVISSINYLTDIGELPKSIVVGLNIEKEEFELTPGLGGVKKLENNLLYEVIPLIDSLYQTRPFRTTIGHYLSGTFALNSLVDNPNLFNAIIAISPDLQNDNGGLY